MTIALVIALAAVVVIAGWLIDRKDKRHDQQLSRLLVHVQAPAKRLRTQPAGRGMGFSTSPRRMTRRGTTITERNR
jgi:hypothetical protein